MKKQLHKALLLLVLSLSIFVGNAFAEPSFEIKLHSLVERKKISRVIFHLTYKANIINSGTAAENVTAELSIDAPHTSVIEGYLDFGDVPGEDNVLSTDTFTIQQDARYPFPELEALVWKYSYTTPVAQESKSFEYNSEGRIKSITITYD